ncbi:hypothetical protein H8S20_17715 [Clostridium sp. NSJ-6]|uniref:Uncharacterized protein n=1 Tax=Clostridium hominis TaxID=2763036 RepID=A0ABR7DIP4_9CLOT|nr:hypothetical protein [Clostridium hominis]MBC5630693.1 hypothetical protein [Clostridium hominis]MDU2670475.1 hypothetical protein [Clostridium sp.]
MWSEKRGIENFIFFAVFPIVINIATNFTYFISTDSYSILEIVNSCNVFTVFSVLICCLFNFLTRQRELSEEEKDELNKKMYGMKLLNIIFIGYIIFALLIVKNNSIFISSIIMYVAYINWYMFKSKSRTVTTLTETQKNWREFHNKASYEEGGFLWRIKPMLVPHVSVSFSERVRHINWFSIIFILLFTKDFTIQGIPMLIIILVFLISDIIYILDMFFGLYTETEGICTGIIMKERGKRSRRIYYEVYVTDFFNKREIKFKVDDYCGYNEGDGLKLIHGGLSKKVVEVKRI